MTRPAPTSSSPAAHPFTEKFNTGNLVITRRPHCWQVLYFIWVYADPSLVFFPHHHHLHRWLCFHYPISTNLFLPSPSFIKNHKRYLLQSATGKIQAPQSRLYSHSRLFWSHSSKNVSSTEAVSNSIGYHPNGIRILIPNQISFHHWRTQLLALSISTSRLLEVVHPLHVSDESTNFYSLSISTVSKLLEMYRALNQAKAFSSLFDNSNTNPSSFDEIVDISSRDGSNPLLGYTKVVV